MMPGLNIDFNPGIMTLKIIHLFWVAFCEGK